MQPCSKSGAATPSGPGIRLEKSALWLIPGTMSLILFALILTRVDAAFAGRMYAAYGGVYIVSSLAWMALVERAKPLLTDYFGIGLCLIGANCGHLWSKDLRSMAGLLENWEIHMRIDFSIGVSDE